MSDKFAFVKKVRETLAAQQTDEVKKQKKRFIELVNRCADFTELTVPMLNECVEKIVVHERDRKGSIQATQRVEIHLNFIGEFIPPATASDVPRLSPRKSCTTRISTHLGGKRNMAKIRFFVVRNAAYSVASIAVRERHNERKNETHFNADIMPERADMNVHFHKHLTPDGAPETYAQTFNRMLESGKWVTLIPCCKTDILSI